MTISQPPPFIDYGPSWKGITHAGWVLVIQGVVTLLIFAIGTALIISPTHEAIDSGVLSIWGIVVGFWFGKQTGVITAGKT